jgi:hypothetical protein
MYSRLKKDNNATKILIFLLINSAKECDDNATNNYALTLTQLYCIKIYTSYHFIVIYLYITYSYIFIYTKYTVSNIMIFT